MSDRSAIVTGAGRGIGAATAARLAAMGYRIAMASRTERELRETADRVASLHPDAGVLALPTDVADPEAIRAMFATTERLLGPVEILVNNAAILETGTIEDVSLEAWDRTMSTNLRAVFVACQEAIRRMKGRGGSIVNVSSLGAISGTDKFPGLAAYTVSKYGVIGLTECLAAEARPHGIRVNCVAPGAVDTKMLHDAAPGLRTKTTPDDVAQAIAFLADPDRAARISGTIFPIHNDQSE